MMINVHHIKTVKLFQLLCVSGHGCRIFLGRRNVCGFIFHQPDVSVSPACLYAQETRLTPLVACHPIISSFFAGPRHPASHRGRPLPSPGRPCARRFQGCGLGPGAFTFGVSRADVGVVGQSGGVRGGRSPCHSSPSSRWARVGGRLAWQICHPGGRSVLTLPTRIKH